MDVSSEERNKGSSETDGIRYLIIIGVDKSSNNIGAKLCWGRLAHVVNQFFDNIDLSERYQQGLS